MLKGGIDALILLWEIHIEHAMKFISIFNKDRTLGHIKAEC